MNKYLIQKAIKREISQMWEVEKNLNKLLDPTPPQQHKYMSFFASVVDDCFNVYV